MALSTSSNAKFKENKEAIIRDLELKFKDNITAWSKCILNRIKTEKNLSDKDIINMTELDLISIFSSMQSSQENMPCTPDNQLNTILFFMIQNTCDINHIELFDFVKSNINQTQNLIEMQGKLGQFLTQKGCSSPSLF